MLLLRKTDLYAQIALGTLMIFSLPVLFVYGFLAGLLLLGAWQLLSALFNTSAFLACSQKRQIVTYWKCTAAVLGAIALCWPLSQVFDPDDVQVLAGIALVASVPLAVFYMYIYRRLIDRLALRKELSGLTKSKA